MILDAGFLVSVDRGEAAARSMLVALDRAGARLHTTQPVVGQVWRDGARQAGLAAFLRSVTLHAFADGRSVGRLLARSRTTDVVDAHLVVLAAYLGEPILTGDPDDLDHLADALGPARPTVHRWP